MNKDVTIKIKKELEEERKNLEEELKSIADRDTKNKDSWKSRFPQSSSQTGEVVDEEEKAGLVEEYTNRLSLKQTLETQLKRVNVALKKIEKGSYGKCSNCGQDIPFKRLKALPSTDVCGKCNNIKN